MSTDLKISQLTPATTVNTNDYTVMVDGNTSANKRATVAQILAIAGAGTVTSINVSGANGINSSGGPITSSGTIALSLGAITPTSIVASGTISGSNLSNTNSGDQAITIVGDVTAPASTGTLTATLANSVVTNDKMADMVGPTVKGRTSGTGIPQDLSTAQVTAMLPEMVADSGTGGSKGLVPPPTAGSAAAKKFLRADATWVATDLNDILPSQSGNIGKVLQTSGTTTSWQAVGVGSVTNVSVTTANGVSGTVANSSTVPAISLTLGAITPTSVNSVVVSGTSTPTLAVTGTSSISGSNTGDQTTITGNAGSATALATGRTIAITGDLAYTSPSFDGTGNVTAAGTLATVASAGTTGGSTAIPVVTINAKGLTTSITTAAVVAPAGTLSGNTLASGVTASSLTSLGTIANLAVTAGTISTTPSASTDIANKLYVDTVAQGLDAKASCIAATTADITLTGTQTIDGIAIVAGNRVLVKNQTLSQNNGIYLCAAGAWTRTTDADTWDELTSAFTFIETGTVNADTGWVCTANAGGTLGTTALPWSQFSGAGSYTASTGLTLTGTAFSLTTPVAVANGGTGISSFGSGIATFLGTPTSANLAAALTDETGSGANVFGTSPTITTPVIAQINDANGNETLKLASIASAVNEVTIENAATGNAVHISATGGDASVGLHLAGKGASGYVNVQDSVDATKRIMFNAAGGTTNTRTMLSSTQTVDRILSLPDATDTLVGKATTDTLTNKTLTSPTITGGALNGTLGATTPSTVAATTGTFSGKVKTTGSSFAATTAGNGYYYGTADDGSTGQLAAVGTDLYFDFLTTLNIRKLTGGTATVGTITSTGLNSTAIGATTASTGAFTTLSSTVAGGQARTLASSTATGVYERVVVNSVTKGYWGTADQTVGSGSVNDLGFTAINNLVLNSGNGMITVGGGGAAITGTLSCTTGANFATSSGSVGIGTTSPSTYVSDGGLALLGAYGTSNAAISIYNNSSASATNIAKIDFRLNNTFSGTGPCAAIYGLNPNAAANNGGALVFSTSANGTSTTPTERMRIDSSGNVGIGTASPEKKLSVYLNNNGIRLNHNFDTADYSELSFSSNGVAGNGAGIRSYRTSASYNGNEGDLRFYINTGSGGASSDGDEAMRINSSGNVGIGTASPAFKLDVMGQAKCAYLFAGYTGNDGRVYLRNTSEVTKIYMDGSGNGVVSIGNDSGTAQLTLSLDSATKPSTNTWTIASDSRVKNVTGEYKKGLAEILALRPITYRYNGKAGFEDTTTENVSIIAQEAINHFPECVGTYLAKLNPEDAEKTELLNWNGHAVTFALINAIKELTARLATLESK